MLKRFVSLEKKRLKGRDEEPDIIYFASGIFKKRFINDGLKDLEVNASEVNNSDEVGYLEVTWMFGGTKVDFESSFSETKALNVIFMTITYHAKLQKGFRAELDH